MDAARQLLQQIEQEEDIFQTCFVILPLATNTVEPHLFWSCSSCQFPLFFAILLQDDDRQASAKGGEAEVPEAPEEKLQRGCLHSE